MYLKRILSYSAYLPSFLFPIGVLFIGLRNPGIFQAPQLLKISILPLLFFFLGIFIAGTISFKRNTLNQSVPGLLLLTSFTTGYFLLASIFNTKNINTNNVYFAADNWSWYLRMAETDGWGVGTRAIHPFVHLLFRPMTAILSILTNGDRFYAMILLLAFAGGSCVWLMWKVIDHISENQTFAILFSSMLGLSASHLIFASVIESYIFSAFCLLLFIWILISEKPYYMLALAGIATLGITITNLVQQGILTVFIKKKLRTTILLFSLITIAGVVLNFASRAIYPATELFILPQNLAAEQRFVQKVNLKRVGLIWENLFVYNVTAPEPYMSIRNEMPRFNFLHGSIREFVWFGFPAFAGWLAIVGAAIVQFFRGIRNQTKETQLSVALLVCGLFNLILQIGYGSEPFLYSAGWTYAVVLFVAINLRKFAGKKWFEATFLTFLMFLYINNVWVLYLIARRVADYLL